MVTTRTSRQRKAKPPPPAATVNDKTSNTEDDTKNTTEASVSNNKASTKETVSKRKRAETKEQEEEEEADEDSLMVVDTILKRAGFVKTITNGGWCLRKALIHLVESDGGSLRKLIQHHGAPTVYDSINRQNNTEETSVLVNPESFDCFQSLCRIVVGQQVAGPAAKSMQQRLLGVVNHNLTPTAVLSLASKDMEKDLQKPAGLSLAKTKSIVDLAQRFDQEELTDNFLRTAPEEEVREALLRVKGIGPWSCDMFLLFHLERPDVLPVGDLGVRKGLARHFGLDGKGRQKTLCPKKDHDLMLQTAAPFVPYRSLMTLYMWKAADTIDFYNENNKKKKKNEDNDNDNDAEDPPQKTASPKKTKTKPSEEQATKKKKRRSSKSVKR